MGKRTDKVIGTEADRKKLKAARDNLEKVCADEVKKNGGKPLSDETPAYVKANKAVIAAEKALPFWGRW